MGIVSGNYLSRIGHTLLTPTEMSHADSASVSKQLSSADLMENAGRAVAEATVELIGKPLEVSGDIVIICGIGGNGGDGFVAARFLHEWGYPVTLMLHGPVKKLKKDTALMAERWDGPIPPIDMLTLRSAGVIIDAIYGAGLSRSLDAETTEIIECANAAEAYRIAIDLPSGLDGKTGVPYGTCFQADTTITFFLKKPGHMITPGRFYCGGYDSIMIADIGIKPAVLNEIKPKLFENCPLLWSHQYPDIAPFYHKYDRGHALVLGGQEPTLGASRLSSLAAIRAGAGLVTLAAPTATYHVQATALTDVMVRKFDSNFGFTGMLSDSRITCALLGPGAGVGEKTANLVLEVAAMGKRMVLDADALTSIARKVDSLRLKKKADVVLTPHEGEFARLFPDIYLTPDRIEAVGKAAERSDCVIALKGTTTIVASPDGRVSIAANAPSWLAVAGTGDVLSGIIASLLAQGMPTFEAVSAGVWLHGEAGMKAGKGLIASDLLKSLQQVLP